LDCFHDVALTLALQDAPPLAGTAKPAASGTGTATAPGSGSPAPADQGGSSMLFYLIPVLLLVWLVMMSMGQRPDTKKKQGMLDGLKKHDRVQTTGGVIGSVVEIKPDVVILKVDEQTNTRVTFAKSAIVGVLKESPASPEAEPSKSKSA